MTTEHVHLRIDADLMAWIRDTAKAEGRSVSGQVGWLLRGAREAAERPLVAKALRDAIEERYGGIKPMEMP